MAVFLAAYDLNTPGKDYEPLLAYLRTFGAYCHAQRSLWFLEWAGSSSQLRNAIGQHLDENDVLFVDRVSDTWAGLHMPKCGQWLNDRGL
jgi:hypothetical protein